MCLSGGSFVGAHGGAVPCDPFQVQSNKKLSGSVDILLPDSEFAVARLFRGEGFPPFGRKNTSSEEAGYSKSCDFSEDVNRAR
jgi:hypothetical protein